MKRLLPARQNVPLLATALVCGALYVLAGCRFHQMFTAQVVINLLTDNAYIGVAAIGMTFVLLTAGVDLSVGSNMFVAAAVALGAAAVVPPISRP